MVDSSGPTCEEVFSKTVKSATSTTTAQCQVLDAPQKLDIPENLAIASTCADTAANVKVNLSSDASAAAIHALCRVGGEGPSFAEDRQHGNLSPVTRLSFWRIGCGSICWSNT